MKKDRLPLSSTQIDLLLAFEEAGTLEALAGRMAKDPSVISRNLKLLAETLPVLAKAQNRWRITPLGRNINVLSRRYIDELLNIVCLTKPLSEHHRVVPSPSTLIVVNAQRALHDPLQGKRSNPSAEKNIALLIQAWRRRQEPILHIKHVSDHPKSFFYRGTSGCEFLPELSPKGKEVILEKQKASAFVGTKLEKRLRTLKTQSLVLVGFTAGECIDATARQASDLGFQTYVVGDATATFEFKGPAGKLHRAEKVHQNTLAHLQAMFAEVLNTREVLQRDS